MGFQETPLGATLDIPYSYQEGIPRLCHPACKNMLFLVCMPDTATLPSHTSLIYCTYIISFCSPTHSQSICGQQCAVPSHNFSLCKSHRCYYTTHNCLCTTRYSHGTIICNTTGFGKTHPQIVILQSSTHSYIHLFIYSLKKQLLNDLPYARHCERHWG